MPGQYRNLNPQVFLSGNSLEATLSTFRYSLGYDRAVGEATVTLTERPGFGSYGDDVTIVVDGQPRWSGIATGFEYTLYPNSVAMTCKGRLQFAADFKLPDEYSQEEKGLQLSTLLGSDTGTDEQIVAAVLNAIGLDLNGGSINGTGTLLGSIAPDAFVWNANDSALAYIQKIDSISVGYRTFESAGGAVFRTRVSSTPSGGADFVFTEGEDITEGNSTRSFQGAYSAVRIGGYSVGDYADPRVWYAAGGTLPGDSFPRVFTFNSEMIERRANSSPGLGVSCEAIAGYWIAELNREMVKVTMHTPRSEVFGPGQVHRIESSGLSRLGVSDNFWVQAVDGELRNDGAFTQTLTYVGGF